MAVSYVQIVSSVEYICRILGHCMDTLPQPLEDKQRYEHFSCEQNLLVLLANSTSVVLLFVFITFVSELYWSCFVERVAYKIVS